MVNIVEHEEITTEKVEKNYAKFFTNAYLIKLVNGMDLPCVNNYPEKKNQTIISFVIFFPVFYEIK